MPRPTNTAQVIWSKIDQRGPDECWPWTGWHNEQGYGRFEINHRSYFAHRAAFHLANPLDLPVSAPADINAFGFLRHTCDNPPCCNPAHLVVGTHAENMRDKVERGRLPDFSGDKGPRCKLSAEDVLWIKFLFRSHRANRPALALLYDVSRSTIAGALSGRHYTTV